MSPAPIDPLYRSYLDAYHAEAEHTAPDAITLAARQVATTMEAAAIVTYTTTGSTASRCDGFAVSERCTRFPERVRRSCT